MGYRSFVVHKERVRRIVAQTNLGSSVVTQTRKAADKVLAMWLLSGGVSWPATSAFRLVSRTSANCKQQVSKIDRLLNIYAHGINQLGRKKAGRFSWGSRALHTSHQDLHKHLCPLV